jgi:hypothetical protein
MSITCLSYCSTCFCCCFEEWFFLSCMMFIDLIWFGFFEIWEGVLLIHNFFCSCFLVLIYLQRFVRFYYFSRLLRLLVPAYSCVSVHLLGVFLFFLIKYEGNENNVSLSINISNLGTKKKKIVLNFPWSGVTHGRFSKL